MGGGGGGGGGGGAWEQGYIEASKIVFSAMPEKRMCLVK